MPGMKALAVAEKGVRVVKLVLGLVPLQVPPVVARVVVLRLMTAQLSAAKKPTRVAVVMSNGVMSKVCSRR